jgi:hypothetical protein
MKYLLLFIAIPTILFSQQWDNRKWETLELYSKNEKLVMRDRVILDIKCYEDGDCYAVGTYQALYLEVFKYDYSNNIWQLIYDGNWDAFNTPEEEWPDIIDQPMSANILSDTTIFIYYYNTAMINIFNFITEEYDTTHYEPAYPFGDAILEENGYGMASVGNFVYTTTNNWVDYKYKDIEFPSSAYNVPIKILYDNRFTIADYDHGKCYFTVSSDGLEWERFLVGEFYPNSIYFIDKNIGFITGGVINAGDSKDDAIYKTTDGGNSWYEVLNQYNQPASWGIYDIVMVKDQYGIATSKTGLVYNSTDQGETWEFDILNQVEKSIFPSYLMSENKTCYMILPKQGLLSYDENLFGITSVPVYNYKSLSVYPNPVESELNFYDNYSIQGLYNLRIFSADSKLVIDKKVFIENGFKINLDLPSGTYYILLEGDEYFYSKIIKE